MTGVQATEQQNARSSVMTAIAELDKLFQPVQASPASSKRARLTSSSKNTSVSTPALMSVLPPSRKRQRLSWLAEEQLKEVRSPKQVYRPLSSEDLLARIATFSLTVWSDRKPEGCSAVDFARRGWKCTGKRREEVICDVCHETWQVPPASESPIDMDALQQDIVTRHGKSCPWRSRSCPPELYRLHLSAPPQQLLRELAERAASFPADFRFGIKHPLATEEVDKVESTLKSQRGREIVRIARSEGTSDLSQSSIVAALFGWVAVPPASSSPSASSSSDSPSQGLILQCKFCARRLAVKRSKIPSTVEGTNAESTDAVTVEHSTAASPDKISSVDVFSSHRRFCPYISVNTESKSGELGYQALLARLKQLDHHNENSQIAFKLSDGDGSKSNLQQTREAVRYVKSLLDIGHVAKRKYAP